MDLDFSKCSIEKAMDEFKTKEKGDGKRGPFYGKEGFPEFDVNDDVLFQNAVWQGYLDASRTFAKIKNTENNKKAFHMLAKRIQTYFRRDGAVFEHDHWCEAFIKEVKYHNEYSARYGQAQKVVNMTFKYLYCCGGAEKYKDRFKDCHMPLDQYTLAWLFTEGEKYYQGWSWFTREKYIEVSKIVKMKLENDILAKELVIWNEFKDRIENLKDANK